MSEWVPAMGRTTWPGEEPLIRERAENWGPFLAEGTHEDYNVGDKWLQWNE